MNQTTLTDSIGREWTVNVGDRVRFSIAPFGLERGRVIRVDANCVVVDDGHDRYTTVYADNLFSVRPAKVSA